jgi:intracellular septation protein
VSEKSNARWVRTFVDFVPAVGFLVTLIATRNFLTATWVLVAASALALAVGWFVEKRLAPLPLFTGILALIFGGLTLYFDDPRFVKMKMTFAEVALGLTLVIGVAIGKNPLKALMGDTVVMPDPAWRTLTFRYAAFFFAGAIANEIIWRTQSDVFWGSWKVGFLVLSILFAFAQTPFMMKHMQGAKDDAGPPEPPVDI